MDPSDATILSVLTLINNVAVVAVFKGSSVQLGTRCYLLPVIPIINGLVSYS